MKNLVGFKVVDGVWTMVNGRWLMDDGLWTMVYGQWSTANGRWTIGYGLWTTIYGLTKPPVLADLNSGNSLSPK